MEYIYKYVSPIGGITMASNGDKLIGLWFDGQKYFADTLGKDYIEEKIPIFEETCRWLDIYFNGRAPEFVPEILINTTSFRREVWKVLLSIPYGKTITYGEIANKIASQRGIKKMSAQAVGNAVGHNPISIIIPCHRVVGQNGKLTGYAAGLDKKLWLLNMEKNN